MVRVKVERMEKKRRYVRASPLGGMMNLVIGRGRPTKNEQILRGLMYKDNFGDGRGGDGDE